MDDWDNFGEIEIRIRIRIDHGLGLKKLYRVIKFNQEAWIKSCADMNGELREKI